MPTRACSGRWTRARRACCPPAFGAQAAVSLHLLTAHKPGIPVILIDTGYLFAETYRFADQLIERFDLNLKIFRPTISRAWMEARHGELWNDGRAGIERYNALRKVEPMKRALAELGVRTWFAGLRRNQSEPGRHADPARAKDAGNSTRWPTGATATCGST
jgi:phosphoadenosine phosphosulfate reductase